MGAYGPVTLGFYADIAGFSLSIQEKTMIGHYDCFLEAHSSKLVEGDPDCF